MIPQKIQIPAIATASIAQGNFETQVPFGFWPFDVIIDEIVELIDFFREGIDNGDKNEVADSKFHAILVSNRGGRR